jgi:hypothetical protein
MLASAQDAVESVKEDMKNVAIVAAGVATFFRNESILYHYDFMDSVYYPLLNRGPPPDHDRFFPRVHTTIDEFSDDNCFYFTGFDKERVRRLKRALRHYSHRNSIPLLVRMKISLNVVMVLSSHPFKVK